MASVKLTRHFPAVPGAVFEVFSDLGRAAERLTGVTELTLLTDGPVGVGTRFAETRVMFGKAHTEEMEFVAFEPGRGYVVSAHSCGCDYRTSFSFVPAGDGTDVTVEFTSTPRTLFAKLMSPLAKLLSGTLRKCLEQDMDDLGAALEREAPAAG